MTDAPSSEKPVPTSHGRPYYYMPSDSIVLTFFFSSSHHEMVVFLAARMSVDTSMSVDARGVFHNIITLAAAVQCC